MIAMPFPSQTKAPNERILLSTFSHKPKFVHDEQMKCIFDKIRAHLLRENLNIVCWLKARAYTAHPPHSGIVYTLVAVGHAKRYNH